MDISKIPKFVIWVGVAAFILVILYAIYTYYVTSYLPPYMEYFTYSCQYANGTSLIIITAKQNLENVTVYNFYENSSCNLGDINYGSMNACSVNNSLTIGNAYVRVYYIANGNQYEAILPCQIVESGG
ncbi:MAG: hypothetical protein RXO36_06895, partial [Candidatus Nanopusillus acidilobi]